MATISKISIGENDFMAFLQLPKLIPIPFTQTNILLAEKNKCIFF